MSVQATTWVTEHSVSEHSARLVANSLANHADPDGTSIYPSIPTIVGETRLGESTVRAGLEKLKALGEIREEAALSHHRTRAFAFFMTVPNPEAVRLVRDALGDEPIAAEDKAYKRQVTELAHALRITRASVRASLDSLASEHRTPAGSAPPQNLHPRRIENGPPQDLALPLQDLASTPAESGPKPSRDPSLEPSGDPSIGREPDSVRHNRRIVPPTQLALAEQIVEHFNAVAQTGYQLRKGDGAASENLSRVLTALNNYPAITLEVAQAMIAAQLLRPYWLPASAHLGHVFGPGVVEGNLEAARRPQSILSLATGGPGLAAQLRASAAADRAALGRGDSEVVEGSAERIA
jgi:hypothetical protein